MIVITGGAGFIGSCLVSKLNKVNINDIVIVDNFSNETKNKNLIGKVYREKVDRDKFFGWLERNHKKVSFLFHFGARTDTTEFNAELLKRLNTEYSKHIWEFCTRYKLPLFYASSAATYGDGEFGFDDNHDLIPLLKPLNPYGISKHEFDKFVLSQTLTPPRWIGLKFFNVYGPNEYHKGRMASVIFHAFNQIQKEGKIKLFRSHNSKYKDGEQLRDFMYVKDVVEICYFLMNSNIISGIYNIGTGISRSFNDLANALFKNLNLKPNIEYIDIPEDIKDKYQYFTQAPINKLRSQGYSRKFFTLEEGISDYLKYLKNGAYY